MTGSCSICDGSGILVSARGETCHAERCTCARGECDLCSPAERGHILTLRWKDADGTAHREVVADQTAHGMRRAEAEALEAWRQDGRLRYVVWEPCRCASMARRIGAFNRADIPASHAHATVRAFDVHSDPRDEGRRKATAVRDAVRAWCTDYSEGARGLMLWGTPGTGKTHLLVACLRKVTLSDGVEARYADAGALIQRLREAGPKASVLRDCAEAPVLLLDDLGRGGCSWAEQEAIETMLDARSRARRTTLVTTNCAPAVDGRKTPESLEARIGQRLTSRLGAMCRWMELGGSDRRRA